MTTAAEARRVKVRRRNSRFTIVSNHLIEDPELSDRAFRLYAALSRLANDAGQLMRSAADINKAMGGSSDKARRDAQRELIARGYLQVAEKNGPAGRRGWNEYVLYDDLDPNQQVTWPDSQGSPGDIAGADPGESAGAGMNPGESAGADPGESAGPSPGESAGGSPAKVPGLAPAISPGPIYLEGKERVRATCRHGQVVSRLPDGQALCPLCRRAESRQLRASHGS